MYTELLGALIYLKKFIIACAFLICIFCISSFGEASIQMLGSKVSSLNPWSVQHQICCDKLRSLVDDKLTGVP